MTEQKKNISLGQMRCLVPDCGADVEVKIDKASRAYYSCNGMADENGAMCNARITFGVATTIKMVKRAKGASDKPAPLADAPVPANDNDPAPDNNKGGNWLLD